MSQEQSLPVVENSESSGELGPPAPVDEPAMGQQCSTVDKDGDGPNVELPDVPDGSPSESEPPEAVAHHRLSSKLLKRNPQISPQTTPTNDHGWKRVFAELAKLFAIMSPRNNGGSSSHHSGDRVELLLTQLGEKPTKDGVEAMFKKQHDDYMKKRKALVAEEFGLRDKRKREGHDGVRLKKRADLNLPKGATLLERVATEVVEAGKRRDMDRARHTTPLSERRYLEEQEGGHITKSYTFGHARRLPKGPHLHLHLNACLAPKILLGLAEKEKLMYIRIMKRHKDKDEEFIDARERLEQGEIQFSIVFDVQQTWDAQLKDLRKHKNNEELQWNEKYADLFSDEYLPETWMRYDTFCRDYSSRAGLGIDRMKFLERRLTFQPDEWTNTNTVEAWKRFDVRTRMMKGLFNYENAYRQYLKLFLQDLVDDNIQYAEIRPNFMPTNFLFASSGNHKIHNLGIMKIIQEEVNDFKKRRKECPDGKLFLGIKVIYCTPRSFSKEWVLDGLYEAIQFKIQFPDLFCGFDLVGQEGSKPQPLVHFVPLFLWFTETCQRLGIHIPFLFHCAETDGSCIRHTWNGTKTQHELEKDLYHKLKENLIKKENLSEKDAAAKAKREYKGDAEKQMKKDCEAGLTTDGNLYDAYLLGALRIAHGHALIEHLHMADLMKAEGTGVEGNPISNEVLELIACIADFAGYPILAHDMLLSISSDNGTLFHSSQSHDFYQTMIGKDDMNLMGWKKVITNAWLSSCFDLDVKFGGNKEWISKMRKLKTTEKHFQKWEKHWQAYLYDIVKEGEVSGLATKKQMSDLRRDKDKSWHAAKRAKEDIAPPSPKQ